MAPTVWALRGGLFSQKVQLDVQVLDQNQLGNPASHKLTLAAMKPQKIPQLGKGNMKPPCGPWVCLTLIGTPCSFVLR